MQLWQALMIATFLWIAFVVAIAKGEEILGPEVIVDTIAEYPPEYSRWTGDTFEWFIEPAPVRRVKVDRFRPKVVHVIDE